MRRASAVYCPDIGDDMEKRARRILDKERIVERTKRLFKGPLRGRNPDHAHVVVDNVTVCSCQMCRNPRHSTWYSGAERLTMQERKFHEASLV